MEGTQLAYDYSLRPTDTCGMPINFNTANFMETGMIKMCSPYRGLVLIYALIQRPVQAGDDNDEMGGVIPTSLETANCVLI